MSKVIDSVIRLSNGKNLIIQPLDARRLFIDTSSVAFIDSKKDENGEIVSVSIEDKFFIERGDTTMIKTGEVKSLYVLNHIVVANDDRGIVFISSARTKTTTFLLPALGKTKKQLRFNSYFENAFLSEDLQHIHLVYRFTGTSIYKSFEQYMITDPLCVTHIECDPYHVVYVFRIPKEFQSDVEHFTEGKYSKFSKTIRQRITKFYGNEASNIMRIIRKDDDLKQNIEKDLGVKLSKDAELASIPDLQFEIQKYE